MTSDKTQIQIFANWPMSHAKRVTRDNRKNPEYRVIAAIRKLRTDKLSSRRIMAKPCKKNELHIGSEKTYGPKNTEQQNIIVFVSSFDSASWVSLRLYLHEITVA